MNFSTTSAKQARAEKATGSPFENEGRREEISQGDTKSKHILSSL